MPSKPRKILQMSHGRNQLDVLCDDGKIWSWGTDGKWVQCIPDLPVREVKVDGDYRTYQRTWKENAELIKFIQRSGLNAAEIYRAITEYKERKHGTPEPEVDPSQMDLPLTPNDDAV